MKTHHCLNNDFAIVILVATGGNETPYTEKDWGNPSSPENFAYTKSKILAEKAAWDYVNGLAGLCLSYVQFYF